MSVTASHYHINTNIIDCNICIEALSKQPHRLVRTRCGHLFHNACFNQWRMTTGENASLQRPCPNCNRPAEDAQQIQREKGCRYVVIPSAMPGVAYAHRDSPAAIIAELRNALRLAECHDRHLAIMRGIIGVTALAYCFFGCD
jgi:Ring finger domain